MSSNNSFISHSFSCQTNSYTYVKKQGEGSDKKILLILPGLTGTYQDLLPLAMRIHTTRSIIIPTYPGWESQPKLHIPHTIHAYAVFINELIKHEKASDVAVIAHCMGAAVALELACCFPNHLTQIILISTPYASKSIIYSLLQKTGLLSTRFPKTLRPLFFLWRARIISFFLAFVILKYRPWTKKLYHIFHELKRDNSNEEVFEQNWVSTIMYDNTHIADIKIPLVMIYGQQDILIPPQKAREFASMNLQARLIFIPEAGHLPPTETPDLLADLCNKILQV